LSNKSNRYPKSSSFNAVLKKIGNIQYKVLGGFFVL